VLFLALLLICASRHLAPSAARFHRLTVEQGLSQSTVSAILRDSKGFMWFGTADGLNRYDGYTFTVYRSDPLDSTSISDNWVWGLCEDKQGNLWIGTQAGGINRYDRVHDRFVRYGRANGLSGINVAALTVDDGGILWAGTWGAGVNRYLPERDRFVQHPPGSQGASLLSDPRVRCFVRDDSGNLWVGTWEGLNRIDLEKGTTEHFTFDPPGGAGNKIQSLLADGRGGLWIGTWGGGLKRFDLRTRYVVHYRHRANDPHSITDNTITSLSLDGNGGLWIGTFHGGLNRFDPRTDRVTPFKNVPSDPASISNNVVLSVFRDPAGTLWVGTDGGGINLLNSQRKQFELYPDDWEVGGALSNQLVHCMLEDSHGDLWIGTAEGLDRQLYGEDSLMHYRQRSGSVSSLSHNSVFALCEDSTGRIWIGTAAGLDCFDRKRASFSHVALPTKSGGQKVAVNAIVADGSAHLWVASSEGGLFHVDLRSGKKQHCRTIPATAPQAATTLLYSLCLSRHRGLYLGSWGVGLYSYEETAGIKERYLHNPADSLSLQHNTVLAMYEDSSGVLWLGTYGGGLDRFDPTSRTFTHFTESDGLPNNVVYGILPDGHGHLWLSTNKGLACFDPATRSCRSFSTADGLPSDEFNQGAFAARRHGELLFGTVNGLVVVRDLDSMVHRNMPPIILTSFTIHEQAARFDRSIWSMEEIHLRYDQNFFAFEFAALDYSVPAKSRYAYMLEGLDGEWVECGTRHDARYTNVAPGNYVFRVRASGTDGLRSVNEASVRLSLEPPFWKTWWFLVLCILASVAVAFLLYRFRVNRLLEMDRLRLRIASDLHDELASNLSTIAMFSRIVQDGVGSIAGGAEEHARLQERITALAQESVGSIRDIIWALDPKKETLHDLLTRLEDTLLPICRARGIHLLFQRPVQADLPAANLTPNVRRHLWLLLKESINNAVKHSECTELNVTIERSPQGVRLEIRDNGMGFVPGGQAKGKGLGTMRMRAKQLGGVLDVASSPDQGTTVNAEVTLRD
jgi:ligand-binding sensor domain-containing protein/signal transduction histidine kinase